MTDKERKDLFSLAQAASPGPWEWDVDSFAPGDIVVIAEWPMVGARGISHEQAEMNASYAAAARPEIVLGLLAEIEGLRDALRKIALATVAVAMREAAREALEEMH